MVLLGQTTSRAQRGFPGMFVYIYLCTYISIFIDLDI